MLKTVIYELMSSEGKLQLIIKDPNEKELHVRENFHSFKESFTTFYGGYYELCVLNKSEGTKDRVNFTMKSGIAAKDYSEVAKMKDLKPIELDVLIYIISIKLRFSFRN